MMTAIASSASRISVIAGHVSGAIPDPSAASSSLVFPSNHSVFLEMILDDSFLPLTVSLRAMI